MLALIVPPGGLAQSGRLFYSDHFVVFPQAECTRYFKENNQWETSQSTDIISWLLSRWVPAQEFQRWLGDWLGPLDISQGKCIMKQSRLFFSERPCRRGSKWNISEPITSCFVNLNRSKGAVSTSSPLVQQLTSLKKAVETDGIRKRVALPHVWLHWGSLNLPTSLQAALFTLALDSVWCIQRAAFMQFSSVWFWMYWVFEHQKSTLTTRGHLTFKQVQRFFLHLYWSLYSIYRIYIDCILYVGICYAT